MINEHTTQIARTLFAEGRQDVAILVMDGTYVEIGKSQAHAMQVIRI